MTGVVKLYVCVGIGGQVDPDDGVGPNDPMPLWRSDRWRLVADHSLMMKIAATQKVSVCRQKVAQP